MPIPKKVEAFLSEHGIDAEVVRHKTVYTVYDLAQTLREKLEAVTKTLLVKADKEYFLVVLPANYRLDIQKFKKAIAAKKVSLATEKEMKSKFNTKPGAMLPFGSLHKLQVVIDSSLAKTQRALFSAGSFTESLRLKMKEYMKAVEPKVAKIGKRVPLKLTVVKKKPAKKKKSTRRKPRKTVNTKSKKRTTRRR